MNAQDKLQIENEFIISKRNILDLENNINELKSAHAQEKKEILLDLIKILDSFEGAEATIKEKGWDDNENSRKAISRLQNSKQRLLNLLEKYNVTLMSFIDSLATDEYCKTIDTEPDSQQPNNFILSVEKTGYIFNNVVLRKAEVIIVKN